MDVSRLGAADSMLHVRSEYESLTSWDLKNTLTYYPIAPIVRPRVWPQVNDLGSLTQLLYDNEKIRKIRNDDIK